MKHFIAIAAIMLGLTASACGTGDVTIDSPSSKPVKTNSREADIKADFTAKVAEQDTDISVVDVKCIDRKDDENALCYADLKRISTGATGQVKITVTTGEDGQYIWESEPIIF